MAEFKSEWSGLDVFDKSYPADLSRLSKRFRVSRFVVLIRAYESGYLTRSELNALYEAERKRPFRASTDSSGGNFYFTQGSRLGRRFPEAIIRSARTGQTLMRDAYDLLGVKKHETFLKLAETMEVAI
jgi:hypothetical protein